MDGVLSDLVEGILQVILQVVERHEDDGVEHGDQIGDAEGIVAICTGCVGIIKNRKAVDEDLGVSAERHRGSVEEYIAYNVVGDQHLANVLVQTRDLATFQSNVFQYRDFPGKLRKTMVQLGFLFFRLFWVEHEHAGEVSEQLVDAFLEDRRLFSVISIVDPVAHAEVERLCMAFQVAIELQGVLATFVGAVDGEDDRKTIAMEIR